MAEIERERGITSNSNVLKKYIIDISRDSKNMVHRFHLFTLPLKGKGPISHVFESCGIIKDKILNMKITNF